MTLTFSRTKIEKGKNIWFNKRKWLTPSQRWPIFLKTLSDLHTFSWAQSRVQWMLKQKHRWQITIQISELKTMEVDFYCVCAYLATWKCYGVRYIIRRTSGLARWSCLPSPQSSTESSQCKLATSNHRITNKYMHLLSTWTFQSCYLVVNKIILFFFYLCQEKVDCKHVR